MAGFLVAGASQVSASPERASSDTSVSRLLDGDFVGVPDGYVYDPSLGALNDYCTSSPDEFPAPLADNADFRGPCARHDICYGSGADQFGCDNALWSDMVTNCEFTYAWYNPLRGACIDTAGVYWAAVVVT
jgi:hypothetical protein